MLHHPQHENDRLVAEQFLLVDCQKIPQVKTCKLQFPVIYDIIIETISIFITLGNGEVEVIKLLKFVMYILCFGNGFQSLLWHILPQE